MTAAEIITDIQNHGFTDTASSVLVSLINDAVHDINGREQWPYLITNANHTWNAGSTTPTAQPTNLTQIISIINETTGTILQPERFEYIVKTYPASLTTQAEPLLYYFIGTQLNVYPVPASSTTLKVVYARAQTTLTAGSAEADILIPARHHRLIVLKVLENLYAQEDDLQASQYFNQKFGERLAMMAYDMSILQSDRPDRIYSVDWEDFPYFPYE